VRTLFPGDCQQGPVLDGLHGPIQHYRRKDHKSVPLLRERRMVRPDYCGPCQLVRRGGAVRDPSSPLCQLVTQQDFSRSFDLCEDTGAAAAFFPSGHGALTGTYKEVSCSEWSGSDGSALWNGACLAGESASFWPAVACGNQGTVQPLPTL
jgi:hypothetical protein